jgi:hypothetical protein
VSAARSSSGSYIVRSQISDVDLSNLGEILLGEVGPGDEVAAVVVQEYAVRAFIVGGRGRPLTKESFGNLFRQACRALE